MLREACDGTAFRLIGIGGSDLCDAAEADRGDLADQSVRREVDTEAAIDRLREKFGPAAVQKGLRSARLNADRVSQLTREDRLSGVAALTRSAQRRHADSGNRSSFCISPFSAKSP